MAMELAGTENCWRKAAAMRPISPRCWPVDPPYWGCARASKLGSGMPAATAKVKRFSSSERRVIERGGMGVAFPLLVARSLPELVDFIFSRRKLKEIADCCRFLQ